MAKTFRQLGYRHGTYKVFADFCELAACSFSNAVDAKNFARREEQYMAVVKKYNTDEVNEFPKLLGMLSNELEYGPRDVMGELFHELELHNEHAGQFFTPYHLCEMMARMTSQGVGAEVEANGFVMVHEPACGSGAMVIGFAKAMYDQQLNYQQCLHVSAIDIDSRCVHMAYLQFSLLHIPAVVYAGNTLTMEMRDAWYTPAHIMGGWDYRLRRRERMAEVDDVVAPVVNGTSISEPAKPGNQGPKKPAKKSDTKSPKPVQLTLF